MSRSVALVAIMLGGCGHTDVNAVAFRAGLASQAAPVPIYLKGQATPAIGTDVALLQAIGHGSEAEPELVTAALAQRGASMGCDAVVRVQLTQGTGRIHASGVCVTWAR